MCSFPCNLQEMGVLRPKTSQKLQRTYSLTLLIFAFGILLKNSYGEENVCFLYSQKNFSGSPVLSLRPSVKVFETSLIFHLASGKGINIQSVKLGKPQCSVLLCDQKHLQGSCGEYTASLGDITNQENGVYKNVKSVDCHCPTEEDNYEGREIEEGLKLQREPSCGDIFRDWHYHGQNHPLVFPGAVGKLQMSRVRSVNVKDGCTVMLWGFDNASNDNAIMSLSVSNSTAFLNNNADNFDWGCCYCDQCSETVCQNAQLNSKFVDGSKPISNMDFSQFVKHSKKIIGIGRNYRWKKVEVAKFLEIPTQPIVFLKPSTSYITEGQMIELPESLGTIFYELELGVVIGKKGKKILESDALDHVAGYFLALDMTAKQFLKRSSNQSLPWEIGKGYDSACPVGEFVPNSHIPNPNDVMLECKVNGEITQSASTSEMIFNVQQIISYVSKFMTLEPYDVILTGTPDGFGALKPGDIVEGRMGNLTSIVFTATSA